MVRWNPDLLDKFIAPGISTFIRAEILDLTGEFPQAEHWLANHFLNNTVRGTFPDRTRQVALAFLRRANGAFTAYHRARQATLDYLDGNDPHSPRLCRYYEAIDSWEIFTINFWALASPFVWLSGGVKAFEKNDGSATYRLHTIGNQVKHVVSCVDSNQCGPNDSVPLWLTNDGLQSFGVVVSFTEAARELRDVGNLANELQDPRGFISSKRS